MAKGKSDATKVSFVKRKRGQAKKSYNKHSSRLTQDKYPTLYAFNNPTFEYLKTHYPKMRDSTIVKLINHENHNRYRTQYFHSFKYYFLMMNTFDLETTLNFYSESFTVAADNAAFVPTHANQKHFLGKIKHTNWAATTNEKTSTNDISKPICVVPTLSSAHIFCVVTLESTYTPTSAEQITIVLNIAQ